MRTQKSISGLSSVVLISCCSPLLLVNCMQRICISALPNNILRPAYWGKSEILVEPQLFFPSPSDGYFQIKFMTDQKLPIQYFQNKVLPLKKIIKKEATLKSYNCNLQIRNVFLYRSNILVSHFAEKTRRSCS